MEHRRRTLLRRVVAMALLWSWLVASACVGIGVDAWPSDHAGPCPRLRVPRASVVHELIHLASFENVHEQAKRLVADWQLPAYKTPNVARQLLDAFEDMATQRTSEAVVNFTRDHTLAYEVTVAATTKSAKAVEQTLVVTPERPFNETVRAFCARFEVEDCAELRTKLYPLVVRDWGCLDDAEMDNVKHARVTVPPAKPSSIREELPAAEEAIGPDAPPTQPILTVNVDGTLHNVTLRADHDLELQAAVLCYEWTIPTSECAKVTDAMRALTRDHAAFTTSLALAPRSSSGLMLRISSPVVARLNPISERVYFDGEWLSDTSQPIDGRRTLCLHYYSHGRSQPQLCGPFPPEEMWFFARHSLEEGYHIVLFAEPSSTDHDGATIPPTFLAARHIWIVSPTVKLLDARLRALQSTVFVVLTIETVAFDLVDPEFRVCALVDDVLECFEPHHLHVETSDTETLPQRRSVFRAALFGVRAGIHTASLLLLDSYNNAFAHSEVARFEVTVLPTMALAPRDPAYFFEPPSARHVRRPMLCPPPLPSAGLGWICDLWRHEWGRYSQNGEDGILQSIFHHLGTTEHKYYVEFGTEDARECNTRYLRELHTWHGLLLDGSHANASINLHQEWISPENINDLFAKYDVPREFDLLSVDVDFNDYWILDAIDRARFSPRVLVIEINSHVPPNEPRVVAYQGPAAQWDGKSAYFGVGVGAMHLWGSRNGYSLVYCESHGVNCFLVRDDLLASVARDDEDARLLVSGVLSATDLHAPPNFFGRNASYPWPAPDSGIVDDWVWLDDQ